MGIGPLRAKLAIGAFAAVALAVGLTYAAVVPRLQSQLVEDKLDDMQVLAEPLAGAIPRQQDSLWRDGFVRAASSQWNVRVVLLEALRPDHLLVVADSGFSGSRGLGSSRLALEALETRKTTRGTTTTDPVRAEVAVPVPDTGLVLLLTDPLDETYSVISVIKRSIFIAGGLAVLLSAVVAVAAGLHLTRRLKGLEEAALGLSRGDFSAPVDTRGTDEVAQLSRAFEEMRVRLQHLDRARREFIANASHELKTPIFALAGFLELFTDERLGEGTRKDFIETMQEQVGRLQHLTSALLDLSKLDSNEMRFLETELSLPSVARSLVEEFTPVATKQGHTLSATELREAIGIGDEARVMQIGRSLLENALRHTPAGTEIEVLTTMVDDRAQLVVADNGPGIPKEERELVFERFYRIGKDTSFGTGLGLSIARELARRMNGEILLECAEGKTVFSLSLPGSRLRSRKQTSQLA